MNEDHYDEVLNGLRKRLMQKHEKYGLSYLDEHCTVAWLYFRRLIGEVVELGEKLFSGLPDDPTDPHNETTEEECYDVAICALLIADKKRRVEE